MAVNPVFGNPLMLNGKSESAFKVISDGEGMLLTSVIFAEACSEVQRAVVAHAATTLSCS